VLNKLFYGDNLEVLREKVADESVDLVYLDPPFNSNRSYNVIFGRNSTDGDASAQIQAFDDTWHWTPVTDGQYQRYALAGELPPRVADALTAFRTLLGENDAMAYLVNGVPGLSRRHGVRKAPETNGHMPTTGRTPSLRVLVVDRGALGVAAGNPFRRRGDGRRRPRRSRRPAGRRRRDLL
jgi:hypothetical protein